MTEQIKKLEASIATLQKAIDSPATPEPQKIVMQEKIIDLGAQKNKLITAEENAPKHKEELLQNLLKSWHPDSAFAFTEDGGDASVVASELSAAATEIKLIITGESPIIDDKDVARLKAMVSKLNGKKQDVSVAGKNIEVVFCNANISTNETSVSGTLTLKLSQTLKF